MDRNLLNALERTANPPDSAGKQNRLRRPRVFGRAARIMAKLYGLAAPVPPEVRDEMVDLLGQETVDQLDQLVRLTTRAEAK